MLGGTGAICTKSRDLKSKVFISAWISGVIGTGGGGAAEVVGVDIIKLDATIVVVVVVVVVLI